ncbi:Ig domain-containing protein [Comamonas sp. JC664]|uniref:Ig domain-containing protein n=1 Tax=Comamonas sp. JC664 TaxID=2801917 RepID=UPI00174A6A79|nr:Ig domain-containing protein [Comamonas sp. JC664]MBL0696937.1 putative Ig domain-containing protein [Comamonas sp. JC664]GHG81607.1 hypothetical protein GCM10012319_34980 [Comamonas sp. KCTC 72670]
MLNRNHVLRTLMGASLWWAAGCQSDAFVNHEGTVRSGTSVPLSLQVHFGPDGTEARDGQMVACVSLPSGWQAPGGTYTYAGAGPVAAQAAEAELVSEAQSAWPVNGAAWHCLVSERLTTGADTVLATAQLTLTVPSVAQGPYRLRYLSGFRNIASTSEGETPTSQYQPANFTGRLERLLHVNVTASTTFDHWNSGVTTGVEVTPSVTRAWHGNGTFLAGSVDRTQLLRSSDGTTWTSFEPLSAGTTTPIRVEQLVYSQLRWLGLSDGRIVVSTDNAFTWSPLHQAPPREGEEEPRRFLALALSGNTLAAVGTAGLVATSRDGATWTDASVSTDYDLVTLAASQGGFLAVAIPMAGGPSDASALARPRAEGSGWELVEPATLSGLQVMQLAGGNGRFVAYAEVPMPPPPPPVGPPASPAAQALQSEAPAAGFYRSEDLGSTWARVGRLQIPSDVLSPSPLVAFVDQSFVVSWTGTPPQNVAALPSFELHVSADAMEWTAHPTGAGGTYTAESFATGGTSVVAVSPRRLLVATRVPWAPPVFVTERLDPFRVGTNYLVALDARGSGTLTFELEGTLPPGLTFRPTGSFHGTPTQTGSSAVTVRARDARGGVAERTFSVDVVSDLSISSGVIPSATQGSPYEARFTASGGRAPYAWNLAGGTLPAGLTLQQTDGAYVLSGRPTLSGNFALTVRVTDSANQTAERSVSLQIVAPPPPTDDGGDAPGGCGCNGGGAGVQALGLAALAMVARIRRKRRQA